MCVLNFEGVKVEKKEESLPRMAGINTNSCCATQEWLPRITQITRMEQEHQSLGILSVESV